MRPNKEFSEKQRGVDPEAPAKPTAGRRALGKSRYTSAPAEAVPAEPGDEAPSVEETPGLTTGPGSAAASVSDDLSKYESRSISGHLAVETSAETDVKVVEVEEEAERPPEIIVDLRKAVPKEWVSESQLDGLTYHRRDVLG